MYEISYIYRFLQIHNNTLLKLLSVADPGYNFFFLIICNSTSYAETFYK